MSAPAGFHIEDKTAFTRFHRSIALLYPFLDMHPLDIVIPPQSRSLEIVKERHIALYRQHVQMSSDKKLPFRDAAASRYRILHSDGPFSPENISSCAGLFSAIVYRGITHNTQFLLEQPTLFKDLKAWDNLYNALLPYHPDNRYFCNRSAYGQAIASRKVDNAKLFWDASGDPKVNSWLNSPAPIDFLDLYHIFQSLYSFGTLVAYQLAVDYATAGKATIPDFSEMGEVLCKIKAGGLKGLRKLGWKCADVEGTSEAFKNVYLALKHYIPLEMQEKMGFSVFTVEHALCKLSRLDIVENKLALDV